MRCNSGVREAMLGVLFLLLLETVKEVDDVNLLISNMIKKMLKNEGNK